MRAHPIGLELAEQADTPKIVGSPNEAARPFVLGFHGEVDEAGGGPRVASIELIGRELRPRALGASAAGGGGSAKPVRDESRAAGLSEARWHYKSIAHTAVVATATGVAALTFAGPASAEQKMLISDYIISHCRGGDDCDLVQLPFAAETGTQTVQFSNTPSNPSNDCARAVVEFSLDGQRLQSRFVGPNWEQPAFNINAAPGKHALGVQILSQSDCKTGDAASYTAHLRVWEDVTPAAPPAQQAPPPAPKQGPLVSAEPGLTGVTFHVTDRSGVASQCTYSSEGYTDSFGLPANGSFDLVVPAIRLFKTRTGTITCDNGTSTNTSVFY